MKILPLGNSTVQVSPEREAYTALRLKYQGLAEIAMMDFVDRFAERFKDMDQLHASCNPVVQQYLVDVIDKAIRDLVAHGVMDIDDDQFLNQHLLPHSSWKEDFAEIDDKYLEIALKAEELNAYRTARRENRGGVIGGGFGLEGAAQGVAVATAANMAIGVVHGIIDVGDKVLSSMGDAEKKAKLYSDHHTTTHLAESVYRLIFQVHFALVDIVNNRQPNRPFDNVSEEDGAKAKGLLENISKGRITGEEVDACLIQALRLNPFEPALYALWLDRHGDVDGNLERIAQYFGGQGLSDNKRKMLLQHKESLKFSSPEECTASLANFEQYAHLIGHQDIADERESILALASRLDRERRTVNGTIYDSLETAQVIRLQWDDEQSRTVNGVIYGTQSEAETVCNKKNVGPVLGFIIFLFPLPNAFLTLQSGFGKRTRLLAHLWLVFYTVFFGITMVNVLIAGVVVGIVVGALVVITRDSRTRKIPLY